MNPILEALIVVAIIALIVTLFFGLIFLLNARMRDRAIDNGFEAAESAPARRGLCNPQLEVPADREFTDPLDDSDESQIHPLYPNRF
jgi:hypothetical protein